MRLLVVDDDPGLRRLLRRALQQSGMDCVAVDSAEGALAEMAGAVPGAFDLILLDVDLPDRPGWEFLEELRHRRNVPPIIVLSARGDVEDRVRGLELGADDYVAKPFEIRELLARIEAVTRRFRAPFLEVADIRVDPIERTVERGGARVDLSPREFDVLRVLAEASGDVVSRGDLLRAVWGIAFDPGTNIVDVAIARLRRKLEASGPRVIQTAPGEGYRIAF
jgi:two-component system copper resistance phosphate regulon response regulator CusR